MAHGAVGARPRSGKGLLIKPAIGLATLALFFGALDLSVRLPRVRQRVPLSPSAAAIPALRI
jgi:hypothetical protein